MAALRLSTVASAGNESLRESGAAEESSIDIDAATWGAAMMRFELAQLRATREWRDYSEMDRENPDRKLLGDLCEQSFEIESDAKFILLNMPAPNLEALRWKLDQIITFDGDDDYMESWCRAYARQTILDYQRLLPAANA